MQSVFHSSLFMNHTDGSDTNRKCFPGTPQKSWPNRDTGIPVIIELQSAIHSVISQIRELTQCENQLQKGSQDMATWKHHDLAVILDLKKAEKVRAVLYSQTLLKDPGS